MATPLEFSKVYKLLNAIKEGDETKRGALDLILNEYKSAKHAESFLHELAEGFLVVGIDELFVYTSSTDMKFIGTLTKEDWDKLAKKNNGELPVHLANTMINYFKDEKILDKLSAKWQKSIGEIEKHVMPMARYITEGLIDVLE